MADVNRGNRPLSPHLAIYRRHLSMMTSITHRITGCGLAVGALMVVWWFLAAARGPEASPSPTASSPHGSAGWC